MAGGLFALLDDVAALARLAAASVDDVGGRRAAGPAPRRPAWSSTTPPSPRSTSTASAAERELPIIKKIAIGSLRNKLLFILPAVLLLSQFLPWLLTPILMVGGAYLCYEGAEKVCGEDPRPRRADEELAAAEIGPEQEKRWWPARSAPTSSCPPRSW